MHNGMHLYSRLSVYDDMLLCSRLSRTFKVSIIYIYICLGLPKRRQTYRNMPFHVICTNCYAIMYSNKYQCHPVYAHHIVSEIL